jgi:pimeloyl-ACP methyl ester carboxylesterase
MEGSMKQSQKRPRRGLILSAFDVANNILRAGFFAAAAWIAYSNYFIKHKVDLEPAIPAERKQFDSLEAGKVSFYADANAKGRPLVLVHSVNAAASAYEMRPLFTYYQGKRPVYALDLPGYGFSDRAKRAYSPQLFANAINEFLSTEVQTKADVVALSLSCEFAAQAVLNDSRLFNSLVFISPTGFRQAAGNAAGRLTRGRSSDRMYGLLTAPLWSRPLFDLIATRPSIRFFLSKSFVGPVPPEMIEYAYATSHQLGAENVPLYFLSGKLFTPEIRLSAYERLDLPVLVVYDRDFFTSFDMLSDLLSKKENWRAARIIPSLGLPHFERTEEVAQALDDFWG